MKCVYKLFIYHAPKNWNSIMIWRYCSRQAMNALEEKYGKSLNRWRSCTNGRRDNVMCARDRACTSVRGAAVSTL